MARFFSDQRPNVTFEAPTAGMGPTPPSVRTEPKPKKEEKKEEKKTEPDREKQAQEPIRKTEGGRYDDVDYSSLSD